MCISSVCFFVCLNNIFLDKCISRTVQEGTLGTLHYRHNLDIIHQQSITIWWRLEGRGWSLDNGAYFSIDFCPFILKQTRTKKRLLHHEKNTHPKKSLTRTPYKKLTWFYKYLHCIYQKASSSIMIILFSTVMTNFDSRSTSNSQYQLLNMFF
jgi:hypothetical protein